MKTCYYNYDTNECGMKECVSDKYTVKNVDCMTSKNNVNTLKYGARNEQETNCHTGFSASSENGESNEHFVSQLCPDDTNVYVPPCNTGAECNQFDELKIKSFNVYGNLCGKLAIPDFREIITSDNPNIIFLSETWTNPYMEENLQLTGYTPVFKHRTRKSNARRDSGGLVVFIHSSIVTGVTEVDWDWEDGICLNLDHEYFNFQNDIYLLCTYIKPKNSSRMDADTGLAHFDKLEVKISELKPVGDIIVMGDLNARTGNLKCVLNHASDNIAVENVFHEQFTNDDPITPSLLNNLGFAVRRTSQDKTVFDYGHKLIDLCTATNMCILNGRAFDDKNVGRLTCCNHRGQSVVDYALVDKNVMYSCTNFNVANNFNAYSDHVPISLSLKCTFRRNVQPSDDTSRTAYKWNENHNETYKNKINTPQFIADLSILSQQLDSVGVQEGALVSLDNIVNDFTGLLTDAAADHKIVFEHVHSTQHRNLWFDEECKAARNDFKTAESIYAFTQTDLDRINMCKLRAKFRKICRSKRKQHDINKARELVNLSKTDSKKFWKAFKKKRKNINPNCDFHSFFKTMSDNVSKLNDDGERLINECLWNEIKVTDLDIPFTHLELETAISKLKPGKSHANDGLLNELFIHSNPNVKSFILKLFNTILATECWPKKWAEGVITPVFKKGNDEVASNYRAIVLISCLAKIFTSILNDRLATWSKNQSIICQEQFGFQKQKSTVDCIFIIQSLLQLAFARGKTIYCAFVDYSTAFDSVNYDGLWYKIHKSGISSKVLTLLKDMYSKIQLCVRSDLVRKDLRDSDNFYFKPTSGVLQGEVISSYLFNLYINDLPKELNAPDVSPEDLLINLLIYADDMCAMSLTRQGLQDALNNLSTYCYKWDLTVNTAKTKCIVFRKNGQTYKNDTWSYRNEKLETVKEFKYLGFVLKSSGSCNSGIEALKASALKALFHIKSICQKYRQITPRTQIHLFNTLIKPILNYASEVWGASTAKCLDVFHRRFLKYILGVRDNIPDPYVYGELGVYPLYIDRHVNMVKYWLKVTSSGTNSLIHKVYDQLLVENDKQEKKKQELDKQGNTPEIEAEKKKLILNWAGQIKNLLGKNGFGYVWQQQGVPKNKTRWFIENLKKRLTDQYLQKWSEDMASTSKNRLFKHIKTEFKFEEYLDIIDSKHHRISLSKIRLGSHNFWIERGRWSKPKKKDHLRICTDCRKIEDEYHCFIECPRFKPYTKKLPANLLKKPSMYVFIKTLNTTEPATMKRLATVCSDILLNYEKYK